MEHDKRTQLAQKREQLQIKLKAETYIERYITPVQEIFDYLCQQGAAYQIAGLLNIPTEYHPYIKQALARTPYDVYGFQPDHLQKPRLKQLIDTVFDRFPSTNELRYVPDLPEYANYNGIPSEDGTRDAIQQVIQALGLQDQSVYVYYLNYGLVLQLSLAALSDHEHEDLFNTWHGDVMVFPESLDWLIAFSLEEEWFGGRK
ncbi:hypothetical protein H8B06_13910 [Sphingobacterium sp. DN00404]|uniref:Uncharacterized protein n=1 Tax=Sphingobacterium micropteri TaxID=2763501 RepID=A0ABR7YRG5_9SPHI|nr:hypothetical protein [Sphingobacterium micropteri]MBD1433929.1 hypothetical protein [Sphingobacterium micropteri]